MRLYRGLKEPYRPEKVVPRHGTRCATDFTDCPLAALQYAHARRGVVLVLDLPADAAENMRVTEENWPGGPARRFMVWGKFDAFIVAALPAKALRAFVRVKGVVAASEEYKAMVLRRALPELLAQHRPGTSSQTSTTR